jgi:poly-gamma-glutamate synthesis protein (capsule biosynthesis protein)
LRLIAPEGAILCSVAAIGDVGVIGTARSRAARSGHDPAFALPARFLAGADLTFANLEFPVGEESWVRPNRSSEFRHDAEVCAALARAGVRVVSLANNHMMDCGPRGLDRTLEACAQSGLLAVGAGRTLAEARRPVRLEAGGRRVVILAYAQATDDAAGEGTPGVAPLDEAMILEDVARWRSEADLLIVSAHWGSMYVEYPPPRVTALARRIAEAGVDLVLGHHPHVIQGAERIGRTLVVYSLGDGVFNCRAGDFHAQVAAEARLATGVFVARLAERAHGLDVEPYRLDDDGFPKPPSADETDAIAARLSSLSAGLGDAAGRFASESAPTLLRYELEGLGHYLRQGRLDKIARVLFSVRPRHLPILWQALWRKASR